MYKLTVTFVFLFSHLISFSQVKFNHISVNDGLSQSAVHDFAQDKYGYMWIATRDGLNRFDGENFEIFRNKRSDPTTIANSCGWSLAIDDKDRVWVATPDGISYLNAKRTRFFNFYPDELEQDFMKTEQIAVKGNKVYVGTHKGVFIFYIDSQTWEVIKGLEDIRTYALDVADDGRVLISSSSGLYIYKDNKLDKVLPSRINFVKSAYIGNEFIYAADHNDLYKFDLRLNLLDTLRLAPKDKTVRMDITVDQQDRIWVTGQGIEIIDKDFKYLKRIRHDNLDRWSLSNNSLTKIYVSRDGSVWIGTNGFGLNKYNKNLSSINTILYNPYNTEALSTNYVSGLYFNNDSLYVGLRNKIDVFDISDYPAKKLKVIDLQEEQVGRAYKIESINGRLIAGTDRGLLLFDENEEVDKIILEDFYVINFKKFDNNKLLLFTGDINTRLKVLDLSTLKITDWKTPSINETILSGLIEEDVVWLGGDHGVIKYNQRIDSFKHYSEINNELTFQVKDIFRDSKGKLWLGTWSQGLYVCNDDEDIFSPFKLNQSLPNQTIYGILEDEENNLWFSSNKGIIAYLRSEEQILHFSIDYGIQSNEFNTGSFLKLPDGRMVFGGVNGVSYFNPKDLINGSTESRLFIHKVIVNQKILADSIWNKGEFNLEPDQRNIKIQFNAISFNSPSGVQYRYKLHEDDPYIYLGNNNELVLSNLEGGEYSLIINSTGPNGVWQEEKASLSFKIETPLIQKLWFQLLLLALLILFGILYGKYRNVRLKEKANVLEEAIKKRTKKINEQNAAILLKNEEMKAQSELLSVQNKELNEQRKELLELKRTLEERVRDRTEDLNLKNVALQKQNIQMEQFSYISSHNLKGPIASIQGLLALLDNEQQSNSQQEIVNRIRQSIDKLNSIVTDLTKIIDLKEDKQQFDVLNVQAILTNVLKDLKGSIEENNIRVELNIEQDYKIAGVRAYLHSIFYNIIYNSIKYRKSDRHDNYIKIDISAGKDKVKLKFEDNGIGIDMKYAKDKLFRLFQRFNDVHEGKGIGLYMTKVQVEAMNGEIELRSNFNIGTEIHIEFPIYNKVKADTLKSF
ncbi:ATP-binding protein [Mangrovivirga sp. M17]|uniref:histidine kinase n=1 Tax=Mangrovivirga halotolerans TaxID=2993936 RepID=A0ABT3RPI4_9BACT|nr:two-component regulator propeller domain-containing protein [Mangrovivirga halotolerans]MCX2743080.1 ATP-binding protein [Mangrovivirga halotolerans]